MTATSAVCICSKTGECDIALGKDFDKDQNTTIATVMTEPTMTATSELCICSKIEECDIAREKDFDKD